MYRICACGHRWEMSTIREQSEHIVGEFGMRIDETEWDPLLEQLQT